MKRNWASLLLSLTAALPLTTSLTIPTLHQPRAGAPIPKSTDSCTITNPLLCTSSAFCNPVSYQPFRPTASALDSATLIYGYYLDPSSGIPGITDDDTALLQRCLETCAGYGTANSCRGVYQARNYPAPARFCAPGGDLTVACLLFGREVGIEDLEVVPEDQRANWTSPVTRNMDCPA